jgi:sigma-E factor negative regulatory protein RseA
MMSSAKQQGSALDHRADVGQHDVRERWSCLMDGEADEAMTTACLREWATSDARRADWALWHAAGDALRSSEVAAFHSDRFAARFAQALAAEPAIIARPRAKHRLITRVVLPGAAVAAAAAMLTVVALPVLRGTADVPQVAQGTSAAPLSPVTPVLSVASSAGPTVTAVATNAPPPHIDSYIAAHRELAGSVGMARTTPYLRTTTVLPER